MAERALAGRDGAVVAMDPRTGHVLALAGVPRNGSLPAVQGLVPGSVMKPFTALVAMDMDALPQPGQVFCKGRASRPIPCLQEHGHIGLEDALSGSCNAYFALAGIRSGVQGLRHWARVLNSSVPTSMGLDAEGGGTDWTIRTFRPRTPWNRTDLANLGVGQGPLLLSPVHVAGLYAAICNGGRPVTPSLVHGDGRLPGAAIVDGSALARIRKGLEGTVTHGTASGKGLETFLAAGKTGSAQLPGRRGLNAWFAGYAPADDPRIVVVVVLTDQEGHGGSVAAPVAAEFLEGWRLWETAR
ncbi:MAG: penicillin-binding transpeptidase domain-containing protein [Planctomycetota bacterium]